MIEELVRRLGSSAVGRVLQRPLPVLHQPLVVALQQAGLDPAAAVGAARLVTLGRLRWVKPTVLARMGRELLRRGLGGHQLLVRLHALNSPEAPALVAGQGTSTLRLDYGSLDARVRRIAWSLVERGVRPRDRVALLLENGVEQIELPLALGWIGARVVQVGWRLKPREVAWLLADSGARALVFHRRHADTVEEALRIARAERGTAPEEALCFAAGNGERDASRTVRFRPYDLLLDGPDHADPPLLDGGGYGGVILYTSGTTGRPKGASRDFRDMGLGPILNFIADFPLGHDERHLMVCPLYHSAGLFFAQMVMGVGGALVVHEHFEPEAVLRTLSEERITSVALVPTMLRRLLQLGPAALRRRDLSSLRFLMSVAAPLPTELAREAEETLGPILYNLYAATETGVVTLARPGEHTARPGTIGRAVLGCQVRLLDEAGRQVAPGEVGELWVRSPMLAGGYHANPEATAAAARDGWFSVGDLARVDGDGYYYLADRKSDMVISGGVNIYPWEIEQRLHQHPAVADCAVVGVPDDEWGESLCAFVVRRPGATLSADEVAAFVVAELADFKRPRRVLFLDELPRNATGKIEKRELRRMAASAQPPEGSP